MTASEKLQSIISGWSNLLYRNAEVEKIALERAKKCAGCPKANSINVCILCNCYIPAKVRSLKEKCKDNQW
jgi:hypothetical protein